MRKRIGIVFLLAVALFLAYCSFSIKSDISLHSSEEESGTDTMFVTDVYNYVAADTINAEIHTQPLHLLPKHTLQSITSVEVNTDGTPQVSRTHGLHSSLNSVQQSLIERTVNSSSPFPVLSNQSWIENVWNSQCSDPLCTQYLNGVDLTKFKLCTIHVYRKTYGRPSTNGTCRFINGTTHLKIGLYSFPGSGNTWVRGLLEKTTGICTGSVYCDASLRVAGFNGEGVPSSTVLAVKTHESINSFQTVIHVVRCPGDAIVSEWNRKHGSNSSGGKHTAHASSQAFGRNREWNSFVTEWGNRWKNGVLKMGKYQQQQQPLLRVFYEDLISNVTHEVIRMLTFLNVPYSMAHLKLTLNGGYQEFHRQREHTLTPFTQQQTETLLAMMSHLVNELSAKGYHDSKHYVQNYLLTCNMFSKRDFLT